MVSMALLAFIYVYRIDMNIEQLMPCSNKHNLHLNNIVSSKNKSKEKSTFKFNQEKNYDTLSLQVQCPGQSDVPLSLSCFLLMLLTESCIFIFVSFIREVVNF